MPKELLPFIPNGLYILLSDIGAELQFHWALYLALTSSTGITFHLINNLSTDNEWAYQTKESSGEPINLLVAVMVAVLEPELHTALSERLATIPATASPRWGNITCRVWVKEALWTLNDEGYICLTKAVDFIEEEAVMEAAENRPRGIRSLVISEGCLKV